MAEVGRPPLLRGRHELDEIGPQSVDIEGLDFLGVVEILVTGVDDIGIMLQHFEIGLVGPPVPVSAAFDRRLHHRAPAIGPTPLLVEPGQQIGAQFRLGHGVDCLFGGRGFLSHEHSFRVNRT